MDPTRVDTATEYLALLTSEQELTLQLSATKQNLKAIVTREPWLTSIKGLLKDPERKKRRKKGKEEKTEKAEKGDESNLESPLVPGAKRQKTRKDSIASLTKTLNIADNKPKHRLQDTDALMKLGK